MMLVYGAGAVGTILSLLFLVNVARTGTVAAAWRRTTAGLPAVTAGVATSGIIIATEILVGLIGLLFMFPELVIATVVALGSYMTVTGLVTFQPETWALVVMVLTFYWLVSQDNPAGR